MTKIEFISASEAPAPPKKQSKFAQELLDALNSVKKDQVIKLTPDEGQSVRGLRTGIGRVAKGAGIKYTAWSDDNAVYVAKQ